jgi:AraC-like DNA-binding protein
MTIGQPVAARETIYDTGAVAEADRLAFWQDAVGTLFPPADVCLAGPPPFFGAIARSDLGTLAIAEIRSVAQHVRRSPRHIARAAEEVFELNFQISGTGYIVQDGREAATSAGHFVMYDSTRPYEMWFDGPFRQMTVKFPSALLKERLWIAERLTAVGFSWRSGAGRVVFELFRALRDIGPVREAETLPRLQDNALDMLATVLCDGRSVWPRAKPRSMTLERAQRFIRANLGDPALSADSVAQACRVSVRTLYGTFAAEGCTPGKWIQAERLEACRRDLEDGLQAGRLIVDIAFAWGFNDSAHFSRLFHARYGQSPRAWSAARRH